MSHKSPPVLQKLVRHGFLQHCPCWIKNIAKIFITSEALYDSRLLQLGLDRIYPSDVFLCSFPKSGNTWLRFLIANLLHPETELSFRNIDRYVPEVVRCPFDLNALDKRPILKTHWPFFSYFPRVIYIHRDPRDVYLSYFHYFVANQWFSGTYSEFIRSTAPNYYGAWNDHIQAAFGFAAQHPEKILILKYEALLNNVDTQVRSLAAFLGIDVSISTIEMAVEKSSFIKLREMEDISGPETETRARGFFRKGSAGQWRSECSNLDVRFIESVCKEGMSMAEYVPF